MLVHKYIRKREREREENDASFIHPPKYCAQLHHYIYKKYKTEAQIERQTNDIYIFFIYYIIHKK